MQIACRAAVSCAVLMLSMLAMPDLEYADSGRWCEHVRDEFERVRRVLLKKVTLLAAQPCRYTYNLQ